MFIGNYNNNYESAILERQEAMMLEEEGCTPNEKITMQESTAQKTKSVIKKTVIPAVSDQEIMQQAKAVMEFAEGNLIDNYLVLDWQGRLKIYQERFATVWSSGYYLIEGDDVSIYNYWYTYIDKLDD